MKNMEDVEVLMTEGGSVNVLHDHSLRRPEGSQRHRVLTWLNRNIFPLDFKVASTPTFQGSPDDAFGCFLKVFFSVTLSLGVMRILWELYVTSSPFSTIFTIFAVAIVASVIVASVIVAVAVVPAAMNEKAGFRAARMEEVKTIRGLIQHV